MPEIQVLPDEILKDATSSKPVVEATEKIKAVSLNEDAKSQHGEQHKCSGDHEHISHIGHSHSHGHSHGHGHSHSHGSSQQHVHGPNCSHHHQKIATPQHPPVKGITKEILKEGTGDVPKYERGTKVMLHFDAYDMNGRLIDSSRDVEKGFEIFELRTGREFVIKGWEKAEKYGFALAYVDQIQVHMPELAEECEKYRVACLLNFAACKMKLEEWEEVIKHTTTVIEKQPNNTKALFRRGQAHLRKGRDLERAKEDFEAVLKFDPKNVEVPRELKVLAQKEELARKKEKAMFTGMFS
eukprot:Colp12_sorted_trinity150504_noHs@25564